MFGPKLNFVISCALLCLRSGKFNFETTAKVQQCGGDGKGRLRLGPKILKAHEMELFSSRQELWLRKAANVKEENLMAFQGR